MRVLIGCEMSGVVRDAFIAQGHDAWSCDIIPTERRGPHIVNDVRNVLDWGWDLAIFHPPCTYLSYAAMRYWNQPGREEKRREAMNFFMMCVHAPIPYMAIENPLGLPCQEYRQPDQTVHPYYFGDPFMKRTCLWLKGLPGLMYWQAGTLFEQTMTDLPEPIYSTQRADGIKKRHFSEARHGSKERSRTFPGIATAFAQQWGDYVKHAKEMA